MSLISSDPRHATKMMRPIHLGHINPTARARLGVTCLVASPRGPIHHLSAPVDMTLQATANMGNLPRISHHALRPLEGDRHSGQTRSTRSNTITHQLPLPIPHSAPTATM